MSNLGQPRGGICLSSACRSRQAYVRAWDARAQDRPGARIKAQGKAKPKPRPVEIIKRTDAGFVVQPKRWVIERTFAWACINRRLARDFGGAAETVRALFQIAMIKLMARRIARYRDF